MLLSFALALLQAPPTVDAYLPPAGTVCILDEDGARAEVITLPTVTKDGVSIMTRVSTRKDGQRASYYQVSADRYALVGTQRLGVDAAPRFFPTPPTMLQGPIIVGTTWTLEYPLAAHPDLVVTHPRITAVDETFVGKAGTFRSCVRILIDERFELPSGAIVQLVDHTVACPGAGIVLSTTTESTKVPGGGSAVRESTVEVVELRAPLPPPKPAPASAP